MGPIGLPEMMGIFIIALLLFGPKKLPELGRTLGKALSEFRRAKNELKNTFESHLQELEREARVDAQTPKLEAASSSSYSAPAYSTPSYTPTTYSYPYDELSPYGSTSTPYAEPNPPAELSSSSSPAAALQAAPPPVLQSASGTVPRTNGVAPVSASEPVQNGTELAAPAVSENHPA